MSIIYHKHEYAITEEVQPPFIVALEGAAACLRALPGWVFQFGGTCCHDAIWYKAGYF